MLTGSELGGLAPLSWGGVIQLSEKELNVPLHKETEHVFSEISEEDEAHDQVWGAEAIAVVVNLTPRQTFYLLEKNLLPAKKIGGRWTASRRRLRAFLSGEAD